MTTATPTTTTELCVGSVLFTDLVGFTEYNNEFGDASALQVLDHQTRIPTSVVERWPDSRIVKEIGDGLMIWFASAAHGLSGAAELLTAVNHARIDEQFPLAMRMGLHYGEAIPRGDDLIGNTINVAARVSDLAGPSELLVSERVVMECASATAKPELRPVGPVRVKGVNEPIWLHRATFDQHTS